MGLRILCILSMACLLHNATAEINIWKIDENFDYVLTDLQHYTDFKSDESYFLSEKTEGFGYGTFYYWIGKKTSANSAGWAAAYAIQQDALREIPFKKKIPERIRREPEGNESDTFKGLFPAPTSRTEAVVEGIYVGVHIRTPRMFLIEREGNLRLKEVKLELRYVLESKQRCFVFASQEDVYAYCGRDVSPGHQKQAETVAKIVLEKRELNPNALVFLSSLQEFETEMYSKFMKDFCRDAMIVPTHQIDERSLDLEPESDTSYAPMQIDSNDDKGKTSVEEISDSDDSDDTILTDIDYQTTDLDPKDPLGIESDKVIADKNRVFGFEQKEPIVRQIFYMGGIKSTSAILNWLIYNVRHSNINREFCYIIDTEDKRGLFVILGKTSDLNLRMNAAGMAEEYLKRNRHFSTPITFIDQAELPNIKIFNWLNPHLKLY